MDLIDRCAMNVIEGRWKTVKEMQRFYNVKLTEVFKQLHRAELEEQCLRNK